MSLFDNLRSRQTVRQYTDRPVDEQLLRRLLEAAARTQTMGNLQLYSVVVTRDAERKARLAPAHFNQPMVEQAPVVLTICADFNRTSTWCRCRKANPGYDNPLSFLNAATDALLYTQTLSLLLEEAGLGVCYLGTTIYQPQQIIDVLCLPELVFPVATLTVGYPQPQTEPQPERLPLDAFVHAEAYEDYKPADIDCLYKEKEEHTVNRHFVELNKTETLAQIFAHIRYTREANEAMSQTLIAALRRQGFWE